MGTPGLRKRVALMTEAEKTRALLVDELTGLGSRRAWDDRDRMPVQAMLDIEGLKWINDNVGWPAGDELLRVVAAAIGRSLEEAASALDVSINTAASRYRYALAKLRERLQPLPKE